MNVRSDDRLNTSMSSRIRVLALTQLLLSICLIGYDSIGTTPDQAQLAIFLALPGMAMTAVLYFFRHTRWAEFLVYIDLTVISGIFAVADALSGHIGGETWVLFQILAPLAIMVLRRPRAALVMVTVTLLFLVLPPLAAMQGWLAIPLGASREMLIRSLAYEVLVVIALAISVYRIGRDEVWALKTAQSAEERLRLELGHTQSLATALAELTHTLEDRVTERSALAEQRAAEKAYSEETLRSVLNSIGDAVVVIDADGLLVHQNPATAQILGSRLELFLPLVEHPQPLLRTDMRTPWQCADLPLARTLRGLAVDNAEMYAPATPQHAAQWFSVTAHPLLNGQRLDGGVAVVRDITATKQAEAELRASEERYALAARGANDGLWDWNVRSNEVFFSPRWKLMLGYGEEDISTDPEEWFGRIHPDDREAVQIRIHAHARRLIDHFSLEYRIRHRDGTYRWMLCRGLAVWDGSNHATRMVGSQTDITTRKLAEERLHFDALHDPLTGLPNRTLLMDRIEQSLQRTRRSVDEIFAVLCLDIDRFKLVNDSLGHLAGDEFLIAVGQRLGKLVRPGDTVARIGSDEFAVLLTELPHQDAAIAEVTKLRTALSTSFMVQDQELFFSASIGVVLSTPAYERSEDLLRDADAALYQAKLRGKDCHVIFDAVMHQKAINRLQLEAQLRRAVEREDLEVYYQPIVDLLSNTLVGFEALVRWIQPHQEPIQPGVFIPLAEDTGLIVPIGYWVLDTACRQLRDWNVHLPAEQQLTMNINLSARQLSHADLVTHMADVLQETGLNPRQIKLEITESVLISEGQEAIARIHALKALGVQVCIDDFGTGYSSLSYLHQFPVDTIKIDRSFVSRLGSSPQHAEIIRAIVTLAHSLGMDTTAEGMETDLQLNHLRDLQCRYGQGWLFAKALQRTDAALLVNELLPMHM